MKRYAQVKSTNTPWFENTASHWVGRRLSTCVSSLQSGAREQSKASEVDGIPNLGGEHIGKDGLIIRKGMRFISKEFYNSMRSGVIKEKDLLLVKDGATIGKISYINTMPYPECSVNEHVYILRTKRNEDTKYIYYLFRSLPIQEQIWLNVRGSAQPGLTAQFLKNIDIQIPAIDEQTKIARYLDYKNYQINKYIRIKKRQIELLKELKQTIINDAVTGKIDVRTGKPYPKYKDSGVDWLGMIPDDWVLRKLKQVASIKPSGVDKLSKEDEVPVNLCNYTDVYNNEYITSDMTFMSATVTKGEFADYSLLKGDIVVTKDSEIWNDIGVPALIIQDIADLVCAYHLCIIRPFHEDLESKFILRALQAKAYQYQFHIRANGITRYGISKNAIGYALIAVPPYDVQKSICVHVNESCLMIDAQIENINNQIP